MASVVFYDGVCGLCSRLVRFLLRRDRDGRLLFAPLQGGLARAVLGRHGYDPSDLDTVYVIADRRAPDRPRRPDSARWGGSERVLVQITRDPSRARMRSAAGGACWRGWARSSPSCWPTRCTMPSRRGAIAPSASWRAAPSLLPSGARASSRTTKRNLFHHRVNGVAPNTADARYTGHPCRTVSTTGFSRSPITGRGRCRHRRG